MVAACTHQGSWVPWHCSQPGGVGKAPSCPPLSHTPAAPPALGPRAHPSLRVPRRSAHSSRSCATQQDSNSGLPKSTCVPAMLRRPTTTVVLVQLLQGAKRDVSFVSTAPPELPLLSAPHLGLERSEHGISCLKLCRAHLTALPLET